tara:strand:- start:609 stop:899 length:291 start_codon:yes stop_codon:yes gene_type:complete
MITIASKISERNYCLYVLIYSIIIFTYIEIAEGWNPIFSLFGLGEWIAMLLGYHSILVIALILKWVLKLFKFNLKLKIWFTIWAVFITISLIGKIL